MSSRGLSSRPPAPDERVGTTFAGRFVLEALLGEGGISKVYLARDVDKGERVALKVLLPEHETTEVMRKRLSREVQALRDLAHPRIVAVLDAGIDAQTPWYAMEHLEGETLGELLRRETIEPARAIALSRQILEAVAFAHARGVLHRDLKPHNVFVRRDGDGDRVTVLDFGLASFVEGSGREGTKLTKRGALLGTPAYMAPEQAAGGHVDRRADVYAVGLILYELLTGRRPFTSRSAELVRRAHLVERVPPLEEADPGLRVEGALEDLVQRALAKVPAERFDDGNEMLAALDALPDPAARRVASRAALGDLLADPTADTVMATPRTPPARGAPPTAPTVIPPIRAARAGARPVAATPRARASPMALAALAFAGALLAALAVVAVAVGIFVATRQSEVVELTELAPSPPPPASPEPRSPEPLAPPVAASPDALAMPEELAPLAAQLATGRSLARRDVATLNRYSRAHPEDPRSRLLLGRHYTSQRSLSWAFPQYEEAIHLDATVTRWPPMLPDLLEMARSGAYEGPAADLIVEGWGADAIDAVERELAGRLRREETDRLEALLARLREQR
ncbi:MAG: serine/threonine protein kinase [Sandaracinaceae bacterium]|nr:serine/threonine protein kinase [Sandaracinaceae bacterium]